LKRRLCFEDPPDYKSASGQVGADLEGICQGQSGPPRQPERESGSGEHIMTPQ